MTALLESIKGLIRRNEGLSDNLSSTEVGHYAAEILNRLRHGSTVEMLELYLRQLRTPGSRQFQVSPAAQILAERVFALFHSNAGEFSRTINFSQVRSEKEERALQ
ncbi:hypothetical protein [Rhodoplanes sp. Z2-YC6860]|uniref:hypothetical protein n=1 Tax=Rhodoplanes sp. Z2-YC6860 TaxID=674703 RepID=UPI0012ED286A|nr:hypothetical protein [Rhodoplanes sp. Z2-YC6860]